MRRDFVVREFGSDHDPWNYRLRILSNPHLTHSFDTYDREEMKMNLSA
jgi:hypothetical protein